MNATTQSENNALAVAPRQQFDLSPQTFDQALTFAKYLADSEMVPKAYRNKPGDCLIAMQWGFEVGLKPLQALQSIATINGKPGLYGDAGKALLLSAGCVIEEDDIAVVESNGRARCKITRPGRPPTERTFSVENAKTAGLWNKEGPWRNYPWRQMAWRAFWFAARDAASDLLRGLPGAEEVMDIPVERNMGTADVVGAPTAPAASYDQAQFDANFAKWSEVIAGGRKKPADLIHFIEAKGNPLTEEQKARLLSVKVRPADQPTDAVVKNAAPALTFAQIAARINAAQKHAELDDLAEHIGAVPDAQQRQELAALVNQRRDELPAFD
ncbi:hypothetical protein [Xenophilus sp. Marseille-Q4582]|uniref:hypothetical protein n=1 Tax=Xenophilus sp. Marseille-Q4582 TaxID=2866600 RepID=UPI001CE3F519|nr:hypothetical protein [Xenophilus sp. Marseille-Q4582]